MTILQSSPWCGSDAGSCHVRGGGGARRQLLPPFVEVLLGAAHRRWPSALMDDLVSRNPRHPLTDREKEAQRGDILGPKSHDWREEQTLELESWLSSKAGGFFLS